jgi:uncharacterized membrane protein YhaH (DUF805 family)
MLGDSMTFSESIQTCFRKYATFEGRASRSEFWWWALFVAVASMIPMLGMIISLATLIPYLAVTARRLHDSGRSGWWQVAPISLILLTGTMTAVDAMILAYAAGFAVLVTLIFLLVWLIRVGTSGPNEFGEDPLGGSAPDDKDDGDGYIRTRIPTVRRD